MADPGVLNVKVYQGDRYEIFMRLRSRTYDVPTESWIAGDYIDLTGYTAKAQIRETKATSDVAAEFTCTIGDQVALPGSVLLVLTPAQTTALTKTSYVYDVQVSSDVDHVTTYLQGTVTVTPEVTRA